MKHQQKRFQYWGVANGKPSILWSNWFDFNGPEEPIQLKGFKGNDLLNEYRNKPK